MYGCLHVHRARMQCSGWWEGSSGGLQGGGCGAGVQVFLTTTHIAIVMEYASGGELFEFVKRSGRLSEDAARFFFQQLISGVDYCHRQVGAGLAIPPPSLRALLPI